VEKVFGSSQVTLGTGNTTELGQDGGTLPSVQMSVVRLPAHCLGPLEENQTLLEAPTSLLAIASLPSQHAEVTKGNGSAGVVPSSAELVQGAAAARLGRRDVASGAKGPTQDAA
jgi:hypothetical protein